MAVDRTFPADLIPVFIHGFLDGPECWRPLIDALRVPDGREVAVRLTMAEGAETSEQILDAYASQVVDCVRRDDRSLGVLLVGHSMGGAVAERAAAELADRLVAMVLITPAPLAGFKVAAEQLQTYRSRLDDPTDASIREAKRARSLNLGAEALSLLVSANQDTAPALAHQQLEAWTGGHTAGRSASRITVPVLLVTSDDTVFTHEFLVTEVGRRFEHLDVRRVHEAGHWPHLEWPGRTASFIRLFAESLP